MYPLQQNQNYYHNKTTTFRVRRGREGERVRVSIQQYKIIQRLLRAFLLL